MICEAAGFQVALDPSAADDHARILAVLPAVVARGHAMLPPRFMPDERLAPHVCERDRPRILAGEARVRAGIPRATSGIRTSSPDRCRRLVRARSWSLHTLGVGLLRTGRPRTTWPRLEALVGGLHGQLSTMSPPIGPCFWIASGGWRRPTSVSRAGGRSGRTGPGRSSRRDSSPRVVPSATIPSCPTPAEDRCHALDEEAAAEVAGDDPVGAVESVSRRRLAADDADVTAAGDGDRPVTGASGRSRMTSWVPAERWLRPGRRHLHGDRVALRRRGVLQLARARRRRRCGCGRRLGVGVGVGLGVGVGVGVGLGVGVGVGLGAGVGVGVGDGVGVGGVGDGVGVGVGDGVGVGVGVGRRGRGRRGAPAPAAPRPARRSAPGRRRACGGTTSCCSRSRTRSSRCARRRRSRW